MKYLARFVLALFTITTGIFLVRAFVGIWQTQPIVIYALIGVVVTTVVLMWAFIKAEI